MIHTYYRPYPQAWPQPVQPRDKYETTVVILAVLLALAVVAVLLLGYVAVYEYIYIRSHPFGVLNG